MEVYLWPALFAALVAMGVTAAVERFGGLVGGLIGTLPTTIVPASLGIAAHSPDALQFQAAMFATAPGMLLNAVFLWVWQVLPPRLPRGGEKQRFAYVLLASLTLWAVGAWGLSHFFKRVGSTWASALAAMGITLAIGLFSVYRHPSSAPVRQRMGFGIFLARGSAAGGAIASAVWIAGAGNGVLAGMAAVFPAIFLTTMVALWWSHGAAMSAGTVGPMMLGSISVSTFAFCAAFAFPTIGNFWGSVLAWFIAALGVQLPLWRLVRTFRAARAAVPAGR